MVVVPMVGGMGNHEDESKMVLSVAMSVMMPVVLGGNVKPNELAKTGRDQPASQRQPGNPSHQQSTHGEPFSGMTGSPSMRRVAQSDAVSSTSRNPLTISHTAVARMPTPSGIPNSIG